VVIGPVRDHPRSDRHGAAAGSQPRSGIVGGLAELLEHTAGVAKGTGPGQHECQQPARASGQYVVAERIRFACRGAQMVDGLARSEPVPHARPAHQEQQGGPPTPVGFVAGDGDRLREEGPGSMRCPQHVVHARAHQEDRGVVLVGCGEGRADAVERCRVGSDHDAHPPFGDHPNDGARIIGQPPVEDRRERVILLEMTCGGAVRSFVAPGILFVRDGSTQPREQGMPPIDRGLSTVEGVEEQAHSQRARQQRSRVRAAGHRLREWHGELLAHGRLQNELAQLVRKVAEDVVANVVAQKGLDPHAVAVTTSPAGEADELHRDRPSAGRGEHRLRVGGFPTVVVGQHAGDLVDVEGELIVADEGVRYSRDPPGQSRVDAAGADDDQPQPVGTGLDERTEQPLGEGITRAVSIVDDEVHRLVEGVQRILEGVEDDGLVDLGGVDAGDGTEPRFGCGERVEGADDPPTQTRGLVIP